MCSNGSATRCCCCCCCCCYTCIWCLCSECIAQPQHPCSSRSCQQASQVCARSRRCAAGGEAAHGCGGVSRQSSIAARSLVDATRSAVRCRSSAAAAGRSVAVPGRLLHARPRCSALCTQQPLRPRSAAQLQTEVRRRHGRGCCMLTALRQTVTGPRPSQLLRRRVLSRACAPRGLWAR